MYVENKIIQQIIISPTEDIYILNVTESEITYRIIENNKLSEKLTDAYFIDDNDFVQLGDYYFHKKFLNNYAK